MAEIVGIPESLIEKNQNNSGGAQYLMKDVNAEYFENIEISSIKLYKYITDFSNKYKIENGALQIWTAGMWSMLWEYWKLGKETRISSELDFSWATSSITEYHSKNIYHLAGVTDATSSDKFYKAKYQGINVIEEFHENPYIFDHISENSSTYEYVKVLKEYSIKKYGEPDYTSCKGSRKFAQAFILYHDSDVADIYYSNSLCCAYPLYKSLSNKYIIFWNEKYWLLTNASCINEAGINCLGGLASSMSVFPYTNNWNHNYKFLKIDVDRLKEVMNTVH